MKWISNILIVIGAAALLFAGWSYFSHSKAQEQSLVEAKERLEQNQSTEANGSAMDFAASTGEAIGILQVPKLGKELPIVEGTDPDALMKGVGHLSESVFPGQGEQILLAGHRDTVFKRFAELEIGDTFIVQMPYGGHEYVIRDTEIVDADDTTVIRSMGEEVLVVSTCYPFDALGAAPERFVFYAYPAN
ncbi:MULTISPECIES: class D sortase [Bhargavaea]|uniref:Class D sortase n=1 Tax=Bhargavaea changchunensis TaxID=2134037 RepID=A0ABW2NE21_9BACL|nr:class D sortase [Bhargavaea sp. CC-171006]